MSDLISRQAAIDGKILIQRTNGVEIYSDEAVPVEYLKRLPSAEPVQHGKWMEIIEANELGETYQSGVYCSECGHTDCYEPNYCPDCGARMDAVAEIV